MLGYGPLTQALVFQGGLSGALQASHGFLGVAVERLSSLPERERDAINRILILGGLGVLFCFILFIFL